MTRLVTTMLKKTMAAIGLKSAVGIPTPENKKPRGQTHSYSGRKYFQASRDLPLFTFETIRLMLQDPEIRLGLAMRAAPLGAIEFAYIDGTDSQGKPKWCPGIEAKDPIVAAWVMRNLQTIWFQYLPGIVSSQKWGWSGGEVTLKLNDDGMIDINEMLPRHSRDVRLLELPTGERWGVQINGVKEGSSTVDLQYPYCYFINFRPEDGEKYSPSILLGAYSPWADQWLNGGALDVRRLFMHKDAYAGASIGYPEEDVYVSGSESPVPAKQIADQIVEQSQSGNVITYPSTYDENGRPKWVIEKAQVSANPQHILEYPKDLDIEKRHGMEIPDGAISNDGSGAWEGKSLPMAAFYAGLDTWVTQIFVDLMPTLKAIAQLNFGEDVEFKIRHKPLALTMLQQQGEKQQPGMQDATGGDPYGGDPSGGGGDGGGMPPMPPPGPQPQRMSLQPWEASNIVASARRALGLNTQVIDYESRSSRIQRMSAGPRHAPKGYTKDNPLVINGHDYVGGNFIPNDQLEHASDEQLKEIESGVKSGNSTQPHIKKKDSKPVDETPFDLNHDLHTKHSQTLQTARQLKLKDGTSVKIQYDAKRLTEGYRVTHKDANGKTDYDQRFPTIKGAADFAATELQRKKAVVKQNKPKLNEVNQKSTVPTSSKPRKVLNAGNYRYTTTDFFKSGEKAKFKDNIAALQTLREIKMEGRSATPEEQETISKWVGWGQMPNLFDYTLPDGSTSVESEENFKKWGKERQTLKDILGMSAYADARASTINGHYTHPSVIKAHWEMAEKLGFNGGRFLEPAVGAGYYLGFMPEHLAKKTHVTAVEMDQGSGEIAQALYPSADVHIKAFQDFKSPDNYFDLTATNVPFDSDQKIYYPKHKISAQLHDYYFLRAMDNTKPGGLIMQITSTGTMDKLSDGVRDLLDENTEFVSAIRFPSDTHKDNAGTEVVTDMIILRKKNPAIPPVGDDTPTDAEPKQPGFTGITTDSLGRLYHWKDGKRVPAPSWNDTVEVPDPDGGNPIRVNRYFAEHPEQILGTLNRTGHMYTGGMKNVEREAETYDEMLQGAIDRLPSDIVRTSAAKAEEASVLTTETLHEGQLVIRDGKIMQHSNGALKPFHTTKDNLPKVTGMILLKDKAREVLAAQRSGEEPTELRAEMNKLYDDFSDKYGALHLEKNRKAIAGDPDATFLLSLEKYNSSTKTATKADVFEKNTQVRQSRAEKADGSSEGLAISLHETGKLSIPRVAELTGLSEEQVGNELREQGLAFQDPSGVWMPASMYLSGNTKRKLEEARHASILDPTFEANVRALEKHQPEDIPADEIGVTLSSPWVPVDRLKEFAASVLGADPDDFTMSRDGGAFNMNIINDHVENAQSTRAVWGDFERVMQSAVNGKAIVMRDSDGNVDKDATDGYAEKISTLQEQFKEWAFDTDPERTAAMAELYNASQNTHVDTQYDGSHQTFPGMVDTFKLRKIQQDAAWRVVQTGRGLLAHEVGTGKTSTMVAAAMELRRMGLAKKPAFAVKNANIEQFAEEAQQLYPDARILSLGKSFDSANRQEMLNRISTGDYDMIIMTHENIAKMQMKPDTIKRVIGEEIAELEAAVLEAQKKAAKQEKLIDLEDEDKYKKTTKKERERRSKALMKNVKQLESRKKGIEGYLQKVLRAEDKDAIYFEDTGIDQLFVDEAHKFKSLPITTKHDKVGNIPKLATASARAMDMLARCRYLQEQNDGRGVVFATGTPITNSMAELYVMQKFIQSDVLRERGVHRFDDWADTYGEISNDLEFKMKGEPVTTQRFKTFMNLPELRNMASEMMDIKRAVDIPNLVRPDKHEHAVAVPRSSDMDAVMEELKSRAKECRGGFSKNMIRGASGEMVHDSAFIINSEARAASVDLRLYDASLPDNPDSKANMAIKNILDIYHDHKDNVQAVFSDIGIHDTNKTNFSLFDDMKKKLVAAGIPPGEIIDFSQKMTDIERDDAQAKLRRGDARIAFGSTERLGTGTNIQKKLKAIHHLDIPYNPSALEQRDGRAFRQGNIHKDTGGINVYKYVQEGSADYLSWQTLANKAGFINQFMIGDKTLRSMEDVGTDDMSPQQMIAIATGDPGMMKQIGLQEEVRKLRRSKARSENEQFTIKKALRDAPARIESITTALKQSKEDVDHLATMPAFHFETHKGLELTHHEESPKKLIADTRREARAAYDMAKEEAANEYASDKWASESGGYYRKSTGKLGKYKGMQLSMSRDGQHTITTPSGRKIRYGGSFDSLEKTVAAMQKHPQLQAENLAAFEKDIERLRKSDGMPFKKAQLLEDREKELAMLTSSRQDKAKLLRESPTMQKLEVTSEADLTRNLERMKKLGLRISNSDDGVYNVHDAGDTVITQIKWNKDGK